MYCLIFFFFVEFSIELEKTLGNKDWQAILLDYSDLEKKMAEQFQQIVVTKNKVREGAKKQSFIYLLLDPRISQNLPGESKVIFLS